MAPERENVGILGVDSDGGERRAIDFHEVDGFDGTRHRQVSQLQGEHLPARCRARIYTGCLYRRINGAAKQHIITDDMAAWAHDVRLDANDQRHADDDSGHASTEDAARAIDFALDLGEYLFVLPDRPRRGHDEVAKAKASTA